MFVLARSELLGQFFNTLTADYKYSRQNRETLSQQVPMQISLKLKTCSRFFIALLKSTLNLEYFERKDLFQSLSIREIHNCERCNYLNVQKAIFHATLRQTTYYRFPSTPDISTEPVSYHSSNNLRYWEYENICPSQIGTLRTVC